MDKRKRNLAVGFTAAVAGSLLIMGSILLQTQLYPQVSHFLSSINLGKISGEWDSGAVLMSAGQLDGALPQSGLVQKTRCLNLYGGTVAASRSSLQRRRRLTALCLPAGRGGAKLGHQRAGWAVDNPAYGVYARQAEAAAGNGWGRGY